MDCFVVESKRVYEGITLYLGIFHMPDPPPGNEYSDHGESSGNVWLKEKHPVVTIALYISPGLHSIILRRVAQSAA